ncbi:hypothetical protein [Heyndrickxia ginsengihumi]|uniref:hypothetical protein n=1 Tax=Heyndrickxia ginsengihumi TaxID=363870 RepID=UPI00046F480E|nr:hypothetical protein [Heyndrickxia ginsengihumi]
MKEKSGYIPGQGRTYTPSTKAEWVDDFNSLLNKSPYSRNQLTDILLQEALESRKNPINIGVTKKEYELLLSLRKAGFFNEKDNEQKESQNKMEMQESSKEDKDASEHNKGNNNMLNQLIQHINNINIQD